MEVIMLLTQAANLLQNQRGRNWVQKKKQPRPWSMLTRGGWRGHRFMWKGTVKTDSKTKYHQSEMVVFEVNKIIIRVHGQRVLDE